MTHVMTDVYLLTGVDDATEGSAPQAQNLHLLTIIIIFTFVSIFIK